MDGAKNMRLYGIVLLPNVPLERHYADPSANFAQLGLYAEQSLSR